VSEWSEDGVVRLTQGAQRQGGSAAADERTNELPLGWGKVMSIVYMDNLTN
jgi:hypothetical protein